MKTNMKQFLMLLSLALVACNVPPDAIKEDEEGTRLNRPQTVFEGTWTWLKTEGEGIAGPYSEDSTSVGYALHYKFGFSDLDVAKEEYKNDYPKVEHYTYTYTVSENSDEQRLTLKNNDTGTEEIFHWELETVEDKNYLILRNTEPCCDNTFEKYLRMIAVPDLYRSK